MPVPKYQAFGTRKESWKVAGSIDNDAIGDTIVIDVNNDASYLLLKARGTANDETGGFTYSIGRMDVNGVITYVDMIAGLTFTVDNSTTVVGPDSVSTYQCDNVAITTDYSDDSYRLLGNGDGKFISLDCWGAHSVKLTCTADPATGTMYIDYSEL